MRALLFVMLASLAACAPSVDQPSTEEEQDVVDAFTGELVMLGETPTPGSELRIRVYRDPGHEVANRYYISAGCRDSGFLDKADGRYWSGTAPAKNGDMAEFLSKMRLDAHCPAEDPQRYVRLMEIMREGATLTFDADHTTATFTAPSKGAAAFERASIVID